MSTRRVVITGTGIVCPIGNNIETFWKNLIDGVCGIDYIKSIPTDDLPVKIAGEVKDFNPADYEIEASFSRKQDKFTLYAVAAAWHAMQESGLNAGEGGNIAVFGKERLGLLFSSAWRNKEQIRGNKDRNYCKNVDNNHNKLLKPSACYHRVEQISS